MRATVIVLLGLYTIAWGLWFVSPFWVVLDQADVYRKMEGFLPEPAWGFNALLAGSIMLLGWRRKSVPALLWGAGAGIYHWGTIGIFYFIGDWKNTGGITCVFLTVLCIHIYRSASIYDYAVQQNAARHR